MTEHFIIGDQTKSITIYMRNGVPTKAQTEYGFTKEEVEAIIRWLQRVVDESVANEKTVRK